MVGEAYAELVIVAYRRQPSDTTSDMSCWSLRVTPLSSEESPDVSGSSGGYRTWCLDVDSPPPRISKSKVSRGWLKQQYFLHGVRRAIGKVLPIYFVLNSILRICHSSVRHLTQDLFRFCFHFHIHMHQQCRRLVAQGRQLSKDSHRRPAV
jgi:hypothetical protein